MEQETSGDVIKINVTPRGKKSPSPPEVWFYVYPYGIKKRNPERVDRTSPVQELKDREKFEREVGKILVERSKILSEWFEEER